MNNSIKLKIVAGYILVSLLILVVGGFSLNTIRNVGESNLNVGKKSASLVEAVMQIKTDTTEAHLWLEEVIAGAEDKEQINAVYELIDSSKWYADAIEHGGTRNNIVYYSTSEQDIIQLVRIIQTDLISFKEIAKKRYDHNFVQKSDIPEQSLDDQFDQMYTTLSENSEKAKLLVQQYIKDELDLVESEINSSTVIIIISSIFVFILAIIIGFIISLYITRPLNNVNLTLKEIAQGEGDLTKQLVTKSNDEIGSLVSSMNQFIRSIRSIITDVKQGTEVSLKSANELLTLSDETNVITQEINSAIGEIAIGATNQANDVEDGMQQIQILSQIVDQFKSNTQTLIEHNHDIKQKQEVGEQKIQSLLKAMEQNITVTTNVQTNVITLRDQIEIVGEMARTIKHISAQTNLLALNAAIEAARAGEHGRGFSIVAQEVRKLADESNQSAHNIESIIVSIQQSTQQTTDKINDSVDIVRIQEQIVNETSSAFTQIESSIFNINKLFQTMTIDIDTLHEKKNTIVQFIESTSALSEETAASSQEVSASAESQAAVIRIMNQKNNELTLTLKQLHDVVNKFII